MQRPNRGLAFMSQPEAPRAALPLAIIANSQTPYRLHLHLRIARELPAVELWSVFTHEVSNAPFQIESPGEIRPVFFGQGEHSEHQSRLGNQWNEWTKAGTILKWMRAHGVRVVVLFGYNDLGRLRIIQTCRRKGIPVLLFGDSNIRGERLRGWKRALKRLIVSGVVRRCTGVLHCGRLGAEYFASYGARPEATFPFPYEPDYPALQSVPPEKIAEVKKRFSLSNGRRYLLYVGRLVEVKRVDLLLEAFARIASDRPFWDLIIAGDGPLKASLEASLPGHLTPRLIWTGFLADYTTLAALYKSADVLVLPSDVEPWGVVVTEAATGLAMVCSSTAGAAADLVRDGVNGRIFPPGDVAALTGALLDVTSPDKVDRMKAESPNILASWRAHSDPVNGLRSALQFAGVLPGDSA
jgi:glycosyltransferase involved in cell wall biosynthesis